MNKKNFHIFVASSLLFLFETACETFDAVHLNEKTPFVLNCFFDADSAIILNLSEYLSFQDSLEPLELISPVKNAEVKLFSESSLVGLFSYVRDDSIATKMVDYYKLENAGILEGQKYSVEIDLPDQTRISAFDILPQKVPIFSVDTITEIDENKTYLKLRCSIRFKDPGGQKNYYSISAIETHYDKSIKERELFPVSVKSDDPLIEGTMEYGIWMYCYFSDLLIENKESVVTCEFKLYLSYRDTNYIDIQLNSLSENYYLYTRSVDQYLKSLDNFYSEPVQIFSNIENGYGIFAGFSRSTYRIYIPGIEK
jgi:hypothetical protein